METFPLVCVHHQGCLKPPFLKEGLDCVHDVDQTCHMKWFHPPGCKEGISQGEGNHTMTVYLLSDSNYDMHAIWGTWLIEAPKISTTSPSVQFLYFHGGKPSSQDVCPPPPHAAPPQSSVIRSHTCRNCSRWQGHELWWFSWRLFLGTLCSSKISQVTIGMQTLLQARRQCPPFASWPCHNKTRHSFSIAFVTHCEIFRAIIW